MTDQLLVELSTRVWRIIAQDPTARPPTYLYQGPKIIQTIMLAPREEWAVIVVRRDLDRLSAMLRFGVLWNERMDWQVRALYAVLSGYRGDLRGVKV